MKVCPQCKNEYSDNMKFCSLDAFMLVSKATPLSEQRIEETRVRVNIPTSQPTFNPPPVTDSQNSSSSITVGQQAPPAQKKTGLIVGIVGACVIIAGLAGALAYKNFKGNSSSVQIEQALNQPDPFNPANNVAQFYEEFLQSSPGKEDLTKVNQAIKTRVSKIGDEAFRALNDEADPNVDWNKVAQSYQLLNKITPNDKELQARAAFANGKVGFNAKKFSEAADNFNKANKLKNNWALALNALGQTYKAAGRPGDAFIAYDQATRTDANFVWGWYNLYQYYASLKKFDEAKNTLNKAIELKPDRASFVKSLAVLQEQQGQIQEAITTYDKYILLEANAEEKIKTQKYINDLKLKPSTALASQPTSNEFDGLAIVDARGQIDNLPIHLNLTIQNGKAKGSYAYDTNSNKLALNGIVSSEGKILLVEKTPKGRESGKFEISRMVQEGKLVYFGTWRDAKGQKTLNFSLEPITAPAPPTPQ